MCTIVEDVAIENSLQESYESKDESDEAKKSLAVLSLDVSCITSTKRKYYMICCHIMNVQEQSTCNQQYELY